VTIYIESGGLERRPNHINEGGQEEGENHQPRSASAPRLGDSPERELWELPQNQPGQVDTLSKKSNLD